MRLLLPAIVVALMVSFVSIASADPTTTSTFLYDFNSNLNPAPASGSNPFVIASTYNATTPTDDGSAATDSRDPDSGVIGGMAFVATHDMFRAPDTYQTFSVSTNASHGGSEIVRLDSLSFDMSTFGFGPPLFGNQFVQIDVLASIDGFGTSSNLGSILLDNSGGGDSSDSFFVDLSGAAQFHNLTNATIDFRFLYTSNLNDNGAEGRVDNISLQLTGVPEPGCFGVLGLVVVAGIGYRRRR